jgi:hypothetical protein
MVADFKFGHTGARATPEYIRSLGEADTHTGAILTVGAIGKLASANARDRDALAKMGDALSDLAARLDRLEKQHSDDAITRDWPVV